MLGDALEQALTRLGLSSSRITAWLGRDCGCRDRKDRLNALDGWARRVLLGKTTMAREYLERLLGTDLPE